jgi:hypothetical protein
VLSSSVKPVTLRDVFLYPEVCADAIDVTPIKTIVLISNTTILEKNLFIINILMFAKLALIKLSKIITLQ